MSQTLAERPVHVALQQPDWPDHERLARIRSQLADRPPLVGADQIASLRSAMADVAMGRQVVLQAGDCAEDLDDTGDDVRRRAEMLRSLAGHLGERAEAPVLRIGRMAGQYGKPRSSPTEVVDGVELPVFRGHLVNGPDPTFASRRPDPMRLLRCYDASDATLRTLERGTPLAPPQMVTPPWVSHEALVVDYEDPQVHRDGWGRPFLGSTHLPWIGERTRDVDGAHVDLLAGVHNPIACKVGPRVTPETLVELCRRLDPARSPGRLTLIARMGVEAVGHALPPLVAAVRRAGHPVAWLCDPLHGNTVSTPDGHKTRHVTDAMAEVRGFRAAVTSGGGVAGGVHLEATPDPVTECVEDESFHSDVSSCFLSLCDPRLRPDQAARVVASWRE